MKVVSGGDPHIDFRNENDFFREVFYKNRPFTGVYIDDLEVTEYRHGLAHGIWVYKYPNGAIHTLSTCENGVIREQTSFFQSGKLQSRSRYGQHEAHVSYFENGQLESRLKDGVFNRWNDRNVLMQHDKTHYFENGRVRILFGDSNDDFMAKYFTPEGELVYTQRNNVWVGNKLIREVDYHHDLLNAKYYDLLHRFDTDDADGLRIHHIWMWFWEIFRNDPRRYFQMVNRLLIHPENETLKSICDIIASHKFHAHIDAENQFNKKAYDLIREYTAYHDQRDPNRESTKVNF